MIVKRKIKRGWAMRVICMMAVFCISALIVLGNGVTALASSYQEGDIEGTTGLGTKSSPILVDNFGELKEAMEDEDIEYIQVANNIFYEWCDDDDELGQPDAIFQNGNKVIQNDYTVYVIIEYTNCDVAPLSHIINTCGNDLTISGEGTIKGRFNVDNHNDHNAVIYGISGTVTLSGNRIEAEVLQVGSYGSAVSIGGRAKLVINSGEFVGRNSYYLSLTKTAAIVYKNNSVATGLELYGNATFEINDGSFFSAIPTDQNKEKPLSYFKEQLGVELDGYATSTGILIKDKATGIISNGKVGNGITVPSGKSVQDYLLEGYGLFQDDILDAYYHIEPDVSLYKISDANLTAEIQKSISLNLPLSASYDWSITEAGDDQPYSWTTIRKHCTVPEGDEAKKTIRITANDNWLDGKEISCHVKTSHQDTLIKPITITVSYPKVTRVDVRNIVEPVVGEHPSYTADVKTNVGSFDDYNLDWYKRDADGMHLMKSSDTFESGCRYYVKFYGYSSKYELDVEDDRDSNDYIFNGSIYANGQKFDGTITSNSSHTDMVVSYIWYGYPDGNEINCKCEFVTKEILEPATFDKNGSRLIVCQYCGKTDDATIRNISICELEKTTYVYTGSDIKPSLSIAYIVNDASGISATELEKEYYDVEYSGKEPGKGTVTITLKGRYSGKKTLDFEIVPQAVKTISVENATTGIKVSWSAATGATGYQVFRSTDNKNFTCIKSLYNGELTYVDTEVNTSGKAYYYKIKAFKKDSDGTEYIGSASASKTTCDVCPSVITTGNHDFSISVDQGHKCSGCGIVREDKIKITTQPKDVIVDANAKATFNIEATGKGLTYKWEKSTDGGKKWVAMSGTTDTRSINTVTENMNGWKFRVKVSNEYDVTVISDVATLTVTKAPVITANLEDVTVEIGKKAIFNVTATGEELTYKWEKSTDGGNKWAAMAGTTNTRTISSVTAAMDGWKFRVKVTDKNGKTVTSKAATLTVKAPVASGPVITKDLENVSVAVGEKAIFTVTATGEGLTYKWEKSTNNGTTWAAMAGTTNVRSISSVTANMNGWKFRVKITDKNGKTVTSAVATLTVGGPMITAQPKNVTVAVGAKATFTVTATGEGLTYKWEKSTNGGKTWVAMAGTTNTRSISSVAASYNGWKFRVIITDKDGKSVTSNAATLTVR